MTTIIFFIKHPEAYFTLKFGNEKYRYDPAA